MAGSGWPSTSIVGGLIFTHAKPGSAKVMGRPQKVNCGGRWCSLFLDARRITTTARLLKWWTDYRAIGAHSCLDAEESRGRLDQWNIAPPRWGRLSGMGAM